MGKKKTIVTSETKQEPPSEPDTPLEAPKEPEEQLQPSETVNSSAPAETHHPLKKKIQRKFVWTDARRESWEKALRARKENVQLRKEQKVDNYLKKKQEKDDLEAEEILKQVEAEMSGSDSENDSDSSYEVIVKKKQNKKQIRISKPEPRHIEPPIKEFNFLWV